MCDSCGGCPYHEFPYSAQPPIYVDGKRELLAFNSKDDIWTIIDLLIEEIRENNKKGKEFDLVESINAQLPFFTCRNHLIEEDIQKDIKRYIYCKELGISAYKGSYGEQPALWVDKFFIIKRALAKRESIQIRKAKNIKEQNG